MSDDEMKKLFLQHNVWPAIQNSVRNCYFIIIGFFSYMGFVVSSEQAKFVSRDVHCVAMKFFLLYLINQKTLSIYRSFPERNLDLR